MKKRVILKGPILTRSGYGEQARFAFRALMSRPDLFDIYIQPLQWGATSWVNDLSEERILIDQMIEKTIMHMHQGGNFDISVQVTIPNEWEAIAPVNIGYTAGIETTMVAHEWIESGNHMDKIVVVSNHSKQVYEKTQYLAHNQQTKEEVEYSLTTPVEVVNYPVKIYENTPELNIDLDYDFNFLSIAQWSPRKNMENTLKWFVEEFENDEVGLVLKTNQAKNCLMDKMQTEMSLQALLQDYPNRKCKVYLLHGDMTDEEIHSLYTHPQMKAFLGIPHGEGFGLPFFEAAYSGMPVITTGWSGQLDYLIDDNVKERFYNVAFDLNRVQKSVVWEGVIVEESMWAYAREHAAKQKMRECYEDIIKGKDPYLTEQLAEHLSHKFSEDKLYEQFVSHIWQPNNEDVADMEREALAESADLAANVGLM
jgi:glycosyltransferase involved in cell wall biosynthesis